MCTITKRSIKRTCIFSVIIFFLLSFFLILFHLVPAYARPKYLLTEASWGTRADSLIFFGILFCCSLFIVILFQYQIWRACAVCIKEQAAHGLKSITARPAYWLINLALIFIALILAYVLEYAYGHWYIGTKNSLGTYFSSYRYWFFSTVLIFLFSFFRFHKIFLKKPEKAFLIIAFTSTLLLASSLPPTAVVSWDDQIHYKNSLELSHPLSIYWTAADYDIMEYVYPVTFEMKENLEMVQSLDQKHRQGDLAVFPAKYRNVLTSVVYLPSGLFLFIGRLLNLPFQICFILGRIGNSLTYTILMYFAIKKLKTGKLILLSFALLPTCIFLASNYNYDSWILGFTALGFSYLFSNLQSPQEPIKIKDVSIILLSFLLGYSKKPIYFPFMLLIFFLPKGKFKNLRHYNYFRLATLSFIFILICSFLLPMLLQGTPDDYRGGSDVNGMGQIAYIFGHPLEYTKTLLTFLKGYLSIENTEHYTQFWAYMEHSSHEVLSALSLAFVAFTDRKESDSHTTTGHFRAAVIFLCFSAICLVATSLYIAFTAVGADVIHGCSPRYILPALFPFLYILGGSWKNHYFKKPFHYYALYASLSFVIFDSIWQLVIVKYH